MSLTCSSPPPSADSCGLKEKFFLLQISQTWHFKLSYSVPGIARSMRKLRWRRWWARLWWMCSSCCCCCCCYRSCSSFDVCCNPELRWSETDTLMEDSEAIYTQKKLNETAVLGSGITTLSFQQSRFWYKSAVTLFTYTYKTMHSIFSWSSK